MYFKLIYLSIGLDSVGFRQCVYSGSVLWHFGFHFLVVILQVYFGIKLKSFSNMGLNLTAQTKTQIKDKMFLDIKLLRL